MVRNHAKDDANTHNKCPKDRRVLINGPDGKSLQLTDDSNQSATCDIPLVNQQNELKLKDLVRIDAHMLPPQITKLDCSDSLLTVFPLFQKSNIKTLNLKNNPIKSFQDISMPESLHDLDVSQTLITELKDLVFPSSLTSLDLSSTKISSIRNITAPNLDTLTLESMLVSNLKLRDYEFPVSQALSIAISDNPDIDYTNATFPARASLYLDDDNLKSIDDFPFPNGTQLISLSDNQLTQFPQIPSDQFTIGAIYLDNNQLTALTNVSLPPNLDTLWLNDNQITQIFGVAFPPVISDLNLSNNPIEYFEVSTSDFKFLNDNADIVKVSHQYKLGPCQNGSKQMQLSRSVKICVMEDDQWNEMYPQTFEWGQKGTATTKSGPTTSSSSGWNHVLPEKAERITFQGMKTSSVVGIIVGCIGLAAMVLGFVLRRRTKRQRVVWDDPVIVAARIPLHLIHEQEAIGRGGYGQVFAGTYKNQPVAIKKLLPEHRKELVHIERLLAEVKLMAVMEHPNIVSLIGVAWDSLTDLCVVVEYMSGGDLRSLLDEYQEKNRPQGIDEFKLRIAQDIANGLTYLHSFDPPVLHRDLKSNNVLLDDQLTARLTDFGLAREASEMTMTGGIGTMLWMAPEVMMGERYDEKADIFSYGVVLSELDTHELPYASSRYNESGDSMPEGALLQQLALGLIRVDFTAASGTKLIELAHACVSLNPQERPSSVEISHQLRVIAREKMQVVCV